MPSPALSAVNDQRLAFRRSECLLKEGTTSNAAYLILSGRVEIRKGAFSSAPQTLAVLGKGEMIGEMSLFDDGHHMASAIAIEDTQVRVVSRDEFKRRIEGLDPVMRGVLRILIKRLRQMGENVMPKKAEVDWSKWKKA